ncbi:GNAT family N-acetyltransferase [Rhodoferax koreense]|uniref:GNAT family N-acetyltransferase n=1 Tax=Rhodoferax koreensis TaxID=1842727 RepID=A0A1P8K4Q8_9BURK|nr:GNAT family N-acetyltransferase [Rhodoferax koreense]
MSIRDFRPGDEAALRDVFFTAVHGLASRHYNPAQVTAWAPVHYDALAWAARLQANRPFVAEIDGQAAGFADLQDSGYIDQFFVAAAFAGRGVGQALMAHILASAGQRRIGVVWANVSLRAEAFFAHHGFAVERRQVVQRRGVRLRNARMTLRIDP